MCLGIPGQVIELAADQPDLARVEIAGVERMLNIGLLDPPPLAPGDWVLVHMGFVLERMTEEEARSALSFFEGIDPVEARDALASREAPT